jgi:uncharacterized protein YdhG (YjbR/CyaY superfamily)
MSVAKKAIKSSPKGPNFTGDEQAAMKARVQELKAEAGGKKTDGESIVLAAIASMPAADRAMAERLHSLIKANAPTLSPKTWYGMPAYANKDGKVICFFRAADKFNERYATFGFNETAKLDEDNMWPIAFALTKLTAAEEAKIAELVKKAVS